MLVALASATAIAILLPAGPDDGCPSPRQVSDAVSAHLPGVVLPLDRTPGPSALRLSVTTDGAGTLRVDLSDPDGGPLLQRRVAPETAARTKAAECVALAETAALIVDRYWHEVGYEVPPAPAVVAPKPPPPPPAPIEPEPPTVTPPPAMREAAAAPVEPETVKSRRPDRAQEPPAEPPRPPNWWIAAGIAAQTGDRGPAHTSVSLAIAIERAALGRRVGLRFSVTGRDPDVRTWDLGTTGQATIVQVPVAMDAYLAFPVGLGRLEPGIGVDLNLIVVTSTEGTASDSKIAAAPAADALLAWSIPLPHDTFLRALALGAVGAPYRVMNDNPHLPNNDASSLLLIETPRWRAELGLQLGVSFH